MRPAGKAALALWAVCLGCRLASAEEEALEKLRQDVQENHAALEEMKATREKIEQTTPLMKKAFKLLKEDRYEEAEQVLSEWEEIDPQDEKLIKLQGFTARLRGEPSLARRMDLWNDYLNETAGELTATPKAVSK